MQLIDNISPRLLICLRCLDLYFFCFWILQELENGQVLLRLAHLYEVSSLSNLFNIIEVLAVMVLYLYQELLSYFDPQIWWNFLFKLLIFLHKSGNWVMHNISILIYSVLGFIIYCFPICKFMILEFLLHSCFRLERTRTILYWQVWNSRSSFQTRR